MSLYCSLYNVINGESTKFLIINFKITSFGAKALLMYYLDISLITSPPLTTRSGLGPLKSLITMVTSVTMSRVGTRIQNIRMRTQVFLSNTAMFSDYI